MCVYIYIHTKFSLLNILTELPRWLSSKEVACNTGDTGDMGLMTGLRRSPGGGYDNPFQNFCLENPMDKGAWWSTVHRGAKSQIGLKQLSTYAYLSYCK